MADRGVSFGTESPRSLSVGRVNATTRPMAEAYIVGAVRSPLGKKSTARVPGAFAHVRADELLAAVLRALVHRTAVDAAAIEDVLAGCVTQVGEQGFNIGRIAALAAGFPESVCGITLNRMCGSSQQAVNFAAMAVKSGEHDVLVACGVESMNRVPMNSDGMVGENPWPPGPPSLLERYGGFVIQGESAERICDRWSLSREDCDAYSARSHQRAAHARASGWFEREIVHVVAPDAGGAPRTVSRDEGIRPGTNVDVLDLLPSSFRPDGRITPGSSSQIADGAAALLVASEAAVARHRLTRRARVVATAVAGADPILGLTATIPVTQNVLAKARLSLDAIDVFEVNEAFASVVLAWQHETRADGSKVNPNGGAIALGHPLGASGARLITSCLHELERTGGRYGLVTMCIGFGQATATIIERVG